MPTCPQCGAWHELLDPAFRRPEAFVRLDAEQKREHARSNDDLCAITLPGEAARLFVRCTLPVRVAGVADGLEWGLWAEVDQQVLDTFVAHWEDPEQGKLPPFVGRLANEIPGYAGTEGLPLEVRATGPTTRPRATFPAGVEHEFARVCRDGVTLHEAAGWVARTGGPHRFDREPHLRVFVCSHVFSRTLPIRYVVHDQDGDWQFLCGGGHEDGPRIVGVGHLVEFDPSLRGVDEHLPRGAALERESPGAPWRRAAEG